MFSHQFILIVPLLGPLEQDPTDGHPVSFMTEKWVDRHENNLNYLGEGWDTDVRERRKKTV